MNWWSTFVSAFMQINEHKGCELYSQGTAWYLPKEKISHIRTPNDHTSLWVVYTLSNIASGAIHFKGSRACEKSMRCNHLCGNQMYCYNAKKCLFYYKGQICMKFQLALDHKKTSLPRIILSGLLKWHKVRQKLLALQNYIVFPKNTSQANTHALLSFLSITQNSFEKLSVYNMHFLTVNYRITLYPSNRIKFNTYVSFADIIRVLVHVSGESEIANLHDVVFRQQDVTCGQIAVNTLEKVQETSNQIKQAKHLNSPQYCSNRYNVS